MKHWCFDCILYHIKNWSKLDLKDWFISENVSCLSQCFDKNKVLKKRLNNMLFYDLKTVPFYKKIYLSFQIHICMGIIIYSFVFIMKFKKIHSLILLCHIYIIFTIDSMLLILLILSRFFKEHNLLDTQIFLFHLK